MSRTPLGLVAVLMILPGTGGCSQFIADKLLVPPRFAQRAERLNNEGRDTRKRWGERMQDFAFASFDGAEIRGVTFLPEGTPRGVIVVLHGLTDQKEAMYCVAEPFARSGYLAVVPDLRAHGTSGGRYTTLGFREKRDQVALLDFLATQGYDVANSGVIGGSLGAAVALQWAAIDPRIKAVVAVAPFADLRDEVRFLSHEHSIPPWLVGLAESAAEKHGGFRVDQICPLAALRTMTTPIYLAHGFKDRIIPMEHSQRLFASARGPVVLQKTVSGHGDIRRALGDPFLLRAVDWMNLYVPADASADHMPRWVQNYATRNLPDQGTVATTN